MRSCSSQWPWPCARFDCPALKCILCTRPRKSPATERWSSIDKKMPVTGDKVTGVREVFRCTVSRSENQSLPRAAALSRECIHPRRRASGAVNFQEIFNREGEHCGLRSPPNGGRRSASLALVFFCCPTGPRDAQAVAENSLRRINQCHTRRRQAQSCVVRQNDKLSLSETSGTVRKEKGQALTGAGRRRLQLRRGRDARLRPFFCHLNRMHPEPGERRAADSVGCENPKSQRSQRCANQHQHIHCVLHSLKLPSWPAIPHSSGRNVAVYPYDVIVAEKAGR